MSAPKLFEHAEDQLHKAAIAATAGLSDFGDKDYLTGADQGAAVLTRE